MSKVLYNELKKNLGMTDAVNEYIETILRKFQFDYEYDEPIEKIAQQFGIRVKDVPISDAAKSIRGHYIVSTHRIADNYLKDFYRHLITYSMNPPKKKDGDSYLHAIFVSIVGSSNQNQYASILYDICEYYRLVRNHIVHITNEETLIQNKYNLVQLHKNEFNASYAKLNAPNHFDCLEFDDFVLYSRAFKDLLRFLIDHISYDIEKIALSIDAEPFYKYKNSAPRFKSELGKAIKYDFNLKDQQIESIINLVLERC
ncbi:MAG: hypothetical protein ACI4LZ_06055 [Anaerovoracaceae bacterium]